MTNVPADAEAKGGQGSVASAEIRKQPAVEVGPGYWRTVWGRLSATR